jgi:hypothetical protein
VHASSTTIQPEKEIFYYSSPLPREINASRPQPGVNVADAKLTPRKLLVDQALCSAILC